MRFHNFEDYSKKFSDYKVSFLKKIGLASNSKPDHEYFEHIGNNFELSESDIPVIISDDFSFNSQNISESHHRNSYNLGNSPDPEDFFSKFKEESWTPNAVDDIRNVKFLKFPIIATRGSEADSYKTLGKLRSAEKRYKKFIEKPQPKTRFKIIAFRENPICAEEKINQMPFDIDLREFKHLDAISKIAKSIYENYKLDVYNIELIESIEGKLYLTDLNKRLNLNPHQAYSVYNNVYQDYYNSKLPAWVKNRIMDEDLSSYYKKKYFDSKLIRSNYAMDYSKLFKK